MYTAKPTTKFKKDLKRVQRRGYDISLLTNVLIKLAAGETLDAVYNDHPLKGKYVGCRECHITPDWLLIYKISGNALFLFLTRTGTHEDLF
jgi:mRNA interferase YafQ